MRTALVGLLLAVVGITLWRGWIAPAGDSFWIDECGTAWVISGGWRDVWDHTATHPNSRVYGLVLWAWAQFAGKGEWALRLPSIIWMAGAMAFLSGILRRNGLAGWPVFVFALMSPELQFFGIDARPYSLALFGYAAASYGLVRFESEGRPRWGLLWAFAAALTYAASAAVGFALAAHAVWILWVDGRRVARWLPYGLLAGALIVLEAWRLWELAAQPSRHLFPFAGGWKRLASALFPLSVIVPGAAALIALWRAKWQLLDGRPVRLGLVTILIPTALIFAQSVRIGLDLMLNRYVIFIWFGWLLLLALISAPRRLAFVTVYATVLLAASLYKTGWKVPHADANWRAAMAAAKAWDAGRGRPIALQTGFMEGAFADWLDDPKRREFLVAPVYAYPYPGPNYLLPYRFDAARLPKIEPPYVMVVYEDTAATSKYVEAMAPDARPLARSLRLRVYAVERASQ